MIKQDKDRTLNIYKASAGSGKTHLLTGFYLKLLFRNELLPETHSGEMRFSEILAVTFTNKATAEMKGRIIEELFKLSTEPEKSDYWKDLKEDGQPINAAATQLKKKATELLVQILNEYSQFNISTIDSFFQKIVRSFARELSLPGSYEVELDSERVLDQAISNFLDKLDAKGDPELFGWMANFSKNRVDEGAGWDFRTALKELAKKVLTSEEYRSHSEQIRVFTDDKKALHAYANMLGKIIRDWRKQLQELGQKGVEAMEECGVKVSDFSGGATSFMSHWAKWAEGEEKKPTDTFKTKGLDPSKWFAKKSAFAKGLPEASTQRLLALNQAMMELWEGVPRRNYMTARTIHEHFYELGILANLDREMTDYCNEQNLMLLSSSTEMLTRLIGEDDAPFIYEKTGAHIHSYMIDEFQDTSGMQWNNFKPLVSNALAEGYQNLIVGDVKQSIYRWRGGNWNLLDSEIDHYEPLKHMDDSSSLTTNWRSLPAIVEFNNAFFTQLAQQLDEMIGSERISRIYKDVAQQLPSKRQGSDKPQGLLDISFVEPLDAEGNPPAKAKKEDLQRVMAQRLTEAVIKLQQNGFEARDIAILCRTNADCTWVAQVLLGYKQEHPDCPYVMDIISAEALQIAARPTTQALISLMRHLLNPESDILRAIAWSNLYQLEGLSTDEALARYFAMPEEERTFCPALAHRPLYEMCEELIDRLPAKARQEDAPFLQALRDLVLEFGSKQSSDLSAFLTWWEESGHKKTISTPEGQNAILVMTVHKSKGLGMPAVVIPDASWDIDISTRNDDILWCEPQEEPFRQEILLPVKLSNKLEETIFADDYRDEREKAVIDNINTAYVALTRAKEAMVVMAPKPGDKSTGLEHWLWEYCQGQPLTVGTWQRAGQEGTMDKEETMDKEGTMGKERQPIMAASGNNAAEPGTPGDHGETGKTGDPGKTRDPGTPGTPGTPGDHEDPGTPGDPAAAAMPSEAGELPKISILHDPEKPDVTAKERGTYIHAALQEIVTAEEADRVISELYMKGQIDPEVISEEEMHATIGRLLKMPEVKGWFAPGLQVINELTMMDGEGNQQRADRIVVSGDGEAIVIDYKTGSSHAGYQKQVRGYMHTLQKMGFERVRGYLLYLKDERVKEVKEMKK